MSHKKRSPQTDRSPTSENLTNMQLAWVAARTATSIDIRLKVVPGSRKDEIVGTYGDRLKLKVAAPPEDGKANAAVCKLLAKALKLNDRDVTIVTGATNPEKIARIAKVCDLSSLR